MSGVGAHQWVEKLSRPMVKKIKKINKNTVIKVVNMLLNDYLNHEQSKKYIVSCTACII